MDAITLLNELLREAAPDCAERFRLRLENGNNREFFTLTDGVDREIHLTATTPSALAAGAHWFLRKKLHFHRSWCGDRAADPGYAATVGEPVEKEFPLRFRPYLNYCTFGYSLVWWDWEQWKREIDFMALNGINMPLAVTGMEMVWLRTLRKFGLGEEEIRRFLSGPAFLPWQYMSNLDSHAGPLPMEWIESHAELGRKILERERAWGMSPILPGFNGHVPESFAARYPEARYIRNCGWCGFKPVVMLDPADPLFSELSRTFLEELIALFGSDHYYGIDLFHEQELPDDSPEYLSGCGRNLARTLLELDPDAVWVMQAWSERREIIEAVPREHLLLLDIGKERLAETGGLYGVPTVWGTIHSFGGQTEIGGDLAAIPETVARLRRTYSNLAGAGAFPESIHNNPVLFQLVFDTALTGGEIHLESWLYDYLRCRYGTDSPAARKAWKLLLRDVYTERRGDPVFAARPGFDIDRANAWAGFKSDDVPERFFPAWGALLDAAEELPQPLPEGYEFDVIDLGRQALSALGMPFFQACRTAFRHGDQREFRRAAGRFLELMDDCDALLGCRPEFRLDNWIASARRWGSSSETADFYEWNARLLLTLWGPVEHPEPLFDYCCREWNGLISGYYKVRWERFFRCVESELARGKVRDESRLPRLIGRMTLEADDFYRALYRDFERGYPKRHDLPTVRPPADAFRFARELYEKYHPANAPATTPARRQSAPVPELLAGFTGSGPVIPVRNS